MPKFLDDIEFIDSTGTPRMVSEYVPKINEQGQYYTGINEDKNDTSVDDGEISKQGKYFTGKNSSGSGNETNGEIYKQGNKWKNDIISTGSTWKEDIISTSDIKKKEVIDAGEQYTSEDGKIAQAQAEAIAAINAKGEEWTGDLSVDGIINQITALQQFDSNHNNIENGEGSGSVQIVYDPATGATGSGGTGSSSYVPAATGRNAFALTARAYAKGDCSVAAGWAATANTKADIALGVSAVAGLTESEFNSRYPQGYVLPSDSAIEGSTNWFVKARTTPSISIKSGTTYYKYDYYLTYVGFKNLVANGSVAFSQGKAKGILTIAGLGATTTGTYTFGIGKNVTVGGTNNIGLGVGINIAESTANQTVIGRYNAPAADASIIFAVGNSSDRKNGMVIAPEKIVAHLPTSVWNTFRVSEIRSISSEMAGAANKIIFGSNCESTANNTFVGGYGCQVENSAHERSILYGLDLRSSGANSAVFGKYNNPDTNIMFMVGAGTSSGARSNALEVYNNGEVKVNKTPTISEGSTDVIRGHEIAKLSFDAPINSALTFDGVITEVKQTAGKISVKRASMTQLKVTENAPLSATSQGIVRGAQLYTEKTDRIAADNAIDAKITAETTRATGRENELDEKIDNAINSLDVGPITGSTSKTITSISETNGKISATYSNISYPVTSVNGKTGAVQLSKEDVGLGLVQNYGQTSTATKDSNEYITSGGVRDYLSTVELYVNRVINKVNAMRCKGYQSNTDELLNNTNLEPNTLTINTRDLYGDEHGCVLHLIKRNTTGDVTSHKFDNATIFVTSSGSVFINNTYVSSTTSFTIDSVSVQVSNSNDVITFTLPNDKYSKVNNNVGTMTGYRYTLYATFYPFVSGALASMDIVQ